MGLQTDQSRLRMLYQASLNNHFLYGLLILTGLFIISRYSFLLFHSLAELFSITVAWAFFLLVWNTRRISKNDAVFALGTAFFCIGFVDLLHALTYKGMGVFSEERGANLPTQLWIAGRYMEAAALFLYTLQFNKKLNYLRTLGYWFSATTLVLISIFYLDIFPDCYIEGSGLTPFKIYSEYTICAILILAALNLTRQRQHFEKSFFTLLIYAIITTTFSELAFTLYISVYGLSNLVGHFLKIISYYLIYLAMIRASLTEPYASLFQTMRSSEARQQHFINSSHTGMWWARLQQQMATTLDKSEQVRHLLANAVVEECNDAFASLMGFANKAELVGQPLTHALGNCREQTEHLIKQFVENSYTLTDIETKLSGEKRDHQWHLNSIYSRWEDEQLAEIMGSVVDISDQKRRQQINDAKLELIDYSANHNVQELLQQFLDTAEQLTESQIGFFHFVEDDQETISLQTWSTNTINTFCDTGAAQSQHYPISEAGVWVDCITTRAPVIHNDYENLSHKNGLPDGHAPISRELVVPVLRQNHVVAILGVGNKATPYDQEDVKVVSEFADTAWETVASMQAKDALQKTLDGLELKVVERTNELNELVLEMNSIFEASGIGILVLRGGRILDKCNQRAANIFGYTSPEEMAGLPMEVFHLSEHHFLDFGEHHYYPLVQGESLQIEYQLKRKDGSPVWCLLSGKALDNATPPDLNKGVLWMVDDISTRKEYEQQLEDLTLKLKSAQKLGKLGWWEYNVVSQQVRWPEETYAMFGLTDPTEPVDYPRLLSLIPEEYHEYHERQLKEILENGAAVFEYPIVLADGSKRWLFATGETEYDKNGMPIRLFGSIQDITDLINTEEKIRLQNQIISQIHDSVISVDLNGDITSYNQGSVRLFQYDQEEAIGQNVSILYPEQSHEWLEKTIFPEIYQQGDMEYETKLLRQDGSLFDAHVSLSLLRDLKGQLSGVIGYTLDISERKTAEQMLVYYEMMASSVDDLFVLYDKNLNIMQINDACAKTVGKSREEILGGPAEQLYDNSTFAVIKPYLERNLLGESTVTEHWSTMPNGQKRYFQIMRNPILDEEGNVFAIASLARDLTDVRNMQDELLQTNSALRQANEDLDQYAYVVSHDLQSPLRAIHNYATFLLEDLDTHELTDEIKLYLDNLTEAVEESKTLVNDLLQLSKIGRKDQKIDTIDLGNLLGGTLRRIGEESGARIDTPSPWPIMKTNSSLIKQIIVNLVSNGIKFNTAEDKHIRIDWTTTDDGHIQFTISDNGIGIEEKYQEQIFKVFQRLHTRKEYSGTGIGLAIVKKAVDTLGGNICLSSTPDGGSTFYVLLQQPPLVSAATLMEEEMQ